jgi:DNA repair exonuclease SbcCD ATPase subunit
MRIARWAFTVVLLTPLIAPLAVVSARAQEQQDDSIAAAARRAQEKKAQQASATKPAKVWDNDNLPDTPGGVSVVGQDTSAPAAGNDAATPPAESAAKAAATKSALEGSLNSAKSRLADLKADLDVAQRKYAMDQSTFYGTTNYASDRDGAAALASEKAGIDDKQEQVAAAEKELAELQSKIDSATQAANEAASQEKAAQSQANNPAPSAPQNPPPAAPPANVPTPDKDR